MAADNHQGVLLKLEKGVLGRKWTKKFVVADHKSLRYFASVNPPPDEAPRKVFNLDDCSVGITSTALNTKFKITKEFIFMVEDRASDYTAIFACENAEERDAWLTFLQNPAPDKRRSHLSTVIEDKLRALNLSPDSKEYAMAVFDWLAEVPNIAAQSYARAFGGLSEDLRAPSQPDEAKGMQTKYLRVLLGHMGKATSDHVVNGLAKELDPSNSGWVMRPAFSAWFDAGGPDNVPDIAPTRQSVMDFDSHMETKEDYADAAHHLEPVEEGDESREVPQKTLDMQAALAAQVAARAKKPEVNPEWDEDPVDTTTAASSAAANINEGAAAEPTAEAPSDAKTGQHTPRTEDSNKPGEGLDVQLVDGAVLKANASVCPSKGPDMGGQSVVIRAIGLMAHAVSSVTVCGVPATIEKQKGNKLVISTGARSPVKRPAAGEAAEDAAGDIQICTLAGPTFIFQKCYSYVPSIDFFAIVRIEQGLPAQKYGFVMTDFGAGTRTQDGYSVSLAFDKSGMSALKHWHKRWFEVNLGVLTSSRSVSDPSEQVLPISDDLVVELEPQTRAGRAHVVRVSTYNKSVLLQAQNEDDQLEWAATLKQAAFQVAGVKVPEMRATDIPVQAFKTVESARANGHAHVHNMTPLEILAQEFGISKKQGKKQANGVPTKEYQGVLDEMLSESPRSSQESSRVDPLNPGAMTNGPQLKVAPRRSATAAGEASGEPRRSSYGYALGPLSGTSSADLFMSELGHDRRADRHGDNYYSVYDGNHAPMLDPELLQFLQTLDVDMTTPMSIVHIFKREQVDFRALKLLTEEELRELGIPLGPRKKILDGLKHSRRRRADSSTATAASTAAASSAPAGAGARDRTTTHERTAMPPLPEPPAPLKSRSNSDSKHSAILTPEKHTHGTDPAHTNSVQKRV